VSNVVSPPATGTLIFRLDSQSCTGGGTINFFLDGKPIGTGTLVVGGADQVFANQPMGAHIAGASEVRANGYTWPSQNVTIPAGSSFTAVLKC
jgi:hypothetical protein